MRAAVIGAGQISKQHLGALRKCNGVEVVGVCDLSPVMAEVAAERFEVPSWFTDYGRLFDQQRPDVVHIVTPPATHFKIASDCLRRGAHVLVEKPVTEEYSQLEELVGIASAERRQVVEDHNYLFNRDVQSMLNLMRRGDLGQVRHIDIDLCLAGAVVQNSARQDPTATVRDFLTHLCYLAYAFVGEHRRVSATWRPLEGVGGLVADNLQVLIEGQWATARIGFSADSQPDTFTIRVQGTRMRVETNLFEVGSLRTSLRGGPKPLMPIRNMLGRGGAEWSNAARSLGRKLSGGPGPYEGMWELIRRFYEGLQRGTEPPVSTQQMLAVNALYHAILREVPVPCAC